MDNIMSQVLDIVKAQASTRAMTSDEISSMVKDLKSSITRAMDSISVVEDEKESTHEIRKTIDDVEFDSWRMSLDFKEEGYYLENSVMSLLDKFAKSKRYIDLALKAAFRRLKNGEIAYYKADGESGIA